MEKPDTILDLAFEKANALIETPVITDKEAIKKIEFVARNIQNRAGVRLLLSCVLAKLHNPKVDIRKPYTEIPGRGTFSGRHYDEAYIASFVNKHNLPCNATTAFLTPALRNRNIVLTPRVNLVGRPPEVYQYVLDILDLLHSDALKPENVLVETVRQLIIYRDESQKRLRSLLKNLERTGSIPLSSEDIISLLEQHLKCKNASRLPVLIVAAAYGTIGSYIKERILDLHSHNSADKQTGAFGDIQVTLINEDQVVTSYEMKMKKVTIEDIDMALHKIATADYKIDNYIFITTDVIGDDVDEYAKSLYEETGGVEISVLDCISFIRHFLHLFHRFRLQYLEEYQRLLLQEPNSAVSEPLKEAFLVLRQASESD